MAVTQIQDVIVPSAFTEYTTQETMQRSALVDSGVAVRNGVIQQQLTAGSDLFTVPFWNDLGNDAPDIVDDDPTHFSVPKKITSGAQKVRKSFLHQSWSAMNLASELAGSDAVARIQARAAAYWTRVLQSRLIASLNGVLADNAANDSGDMVTDISGGTGDAALFSPEAVIDAAGTLGDAMGGLSAIAMHSAVFRAALKNDLIATIPDSRGGLISTFRGLAVIVDDGMPVTAGVYTSVLFGGSAVGYGVSPPAIAKGTEIENIPSSGNGGGQQVLHSRVNIAIHPAGFTWLEGTVAGESPTIAELALAANWSRVVERKAVPLAFLKHKV